MQVNNNLPILNFSGACVAPEQLVVQTTTAWEQLLKQLEGDKQIVLTMSAQSRASLAVHYALSLEELHGKLETLFRSWSVTHFYDISFARQISLVESVEEFLRRSNSELPMVCGTCPGFVARAEASYADFILPLMSTTKSPQQVCKNNYSLSKTNFTCRSWAA